MNTPAIQALGVTQDSFSGRWQARGYVEGLGWLEAWGMNLPTTLAALQALATQRVAEATGEARTPPRQPKPDADGERGEAQLKLG